jgi:hypothetical protein
LPRTQRHWYGPILILAVNWFANFLHFTQLGLYEDDWYFVGFPFGVSFKQWMVDCLRAQLTTPEASVGRPLQFLFSFTFAELGAMANSLAVDYLIAFGISAAASLLMYYVLRQRFSLLVATLATLLFVVSPLHTLHQFVLYQFSLGASFSLVFLAMLLYLRGRRAWSYVFALLSLLTYESIFFVFLAAPLMRRGRMFQGRRREWLLHIAVCTLIVAAYYLARVVTAEARVSSLPPGRELFWLVLNSWLVYTVSSFTPYYYGALRAYREATVEAWIYASLCGLLVAGFFYWYSRVRPAAGSHRGSALAWIVRPAFIGFVFLALGYVLAYFVLLEPHARLPFTDRNTRASLAASFGSSVLLAAILGSLIRLARTKEARTGLYLFASTFVAVLFLYAFVLQNDYAKDWAMQRETARQFMALTPDVHEDSILVLRFPGIDPGLAGQPAIGADQDGYDEVIQHIYDRSQKLPRLFIVVSDDWPKYLKQTPDGFMTWKAPFFPGRWYPSTGRYRPGRFVVLDEQGRGHMVRKSDPILVDGVDIVQHAPPVAPTSPLWTAWQRTPLFGKLLVQ